MAGLLALGALALGLTETEAQRPPAPLPQAGPARAVSDRGAPRKLPKSVPLPPARPAELIAEEQAQQKAGDSEKAVPDQQASATPAPFSFPPLFGPPPEKPSPVEAAEPEAAAAAVPLPPPPPGRRTAPAAEAPAAPPPSAPPASAAPTAAEAPAPAGDGQLPPACARLVAEGAISAAPVRDLEVKDGCSLPAPVSLSAVRLKDGRLLPLKPAAILRCEMVKAVADWVREDLAPTVTALGKPVEVVRVAASFGCRPRNNVKGARVSEHGFGNAIDIGGFETDGGDLEVRNGGLSADFQKRMKESACRRFTTVLGPGSDGYHEDHIHVDLAQRRGGYRLCRWIIKDKTPAVAAPLPQTKPSPADAAQARAGGAEPPTPADKDGADKAGRKSGADKAQAKSGAEKTQAKSGADKAQVKRGADKTQAKSGAGKSTGKGGTDKMKSKGAASDAKSGSKSGGG